MKPKQRRKYRNGKNTKDDGNRAALRRGYTKCESCGRDKGHFWQCPVLGRIIDEVKG